MGKESRVDAIAAATFERELETSIRVRARWMGVIMCAVWLYALLLVDATLYGASTARLRFRILQVSFSVAMVVLLRAPRALWLTELLVTAGACAISAGGATSLLKLPESTFGFGVAFRFFAPMIIAYFLQLRWRAVAALHSVTWVSICTAGYLRDPHQAGHQIVLVGMVISIPYLLLVYEARRREVRQRGEVTLREALRDANERLRDEEESRTRLFMNLNHDFRTPLALIRAEAELLRSELPSAAQREPLRRIEANCEYLADLSEQLLELARLDTGQTPCQPKPTSIDALAREVAAQLQPPDGVPQIRVEGQRLVVEADPMQLRRILYNLVENARRQPRVRQVTLSITGEGSSVHVDVSDDGGGVPADRRDRIFERFASFDKDGRTVSGIGLPLSRELATLNGGALTLLPDQKTTFRLTLRASADVPALSDLKVVPLPANTGAPASSEGARPILLVEDNPEMRGLLVRALGTAFDVHAVGSVSAAREELDGLLPVAVVTDLMLPDGRGTELIPALRARRTHEGIPLLIVSALGSPEHRVEGLQAGADDYIPKPFSPAELLTRVQTAIARGEARQTALHKQREDFVMELHDGVSSSLARAAILLDAGQADTALMTIREGLGEARGLMNLLETAPATLDAVLDELRRLLATTCAQTGLTLDFSADDRIGPVVLTAAERHTLQRIARESLTNTVKHAQASRFSCRVIAEGSVIRVRLEDDGKGICEKTSGRGLGILKRRAAQLGGNVRIGPRAPTGTWVEAEIPLTNTTREEEPSVAAIPQSA